MLLLATDGRTNGRTDGSCQSRLLWASMFFLCFCNILKFSPHLPVISANLLFLGDDCTFFRVMPLCHLGANQCACRPPSHQFSTRLSSLSLSLLSLLLLYHFQKIMLLRIYSSYCDDVIIGLFHLLTPSSSKNPSTSSYSIIITTNTQQQREKNRTEEKRRTPMDDDDDVLYIEYCYTREKLHENLQFLYKNFLTFLHLTLLVSGFVKENRKKIEPYLGL